MTEWFILHDHKFKKKQSEYTICQKFAEGHIQRLFTISRFLLFVHFACVYNKISCLFRCLYDEFCRWVGSVAFVFVILNYSDRFDICVTESRWEPKRALRTEGRVLGRGHFQQALAPTWYQGMLALAFCGPYLVSRFQMIVSARDRCHQYRIYMPLMKLLLYHRTHKVTRHQQQLAQTPILVQTKRSDQLPAPHWRSAGCTLRTRCLHIFGL